MICLNFGNLIEPKKESSLLSQPLAPFKKGKINKVNIYLDIDGVILTKDGTPSNYLTEFLQHITSKHEVYWLTTHCKGDAAYTLNYLARFLDKEILEILKNVKATTFNTLKTEAIDFSENFVWLDDYLFDSEIDELKKRGKLGSWIQIDLRANPNQLLDLMGVTKSVKATVGQPPL